MSIEPEVAELATVCGVSLTYVDWRGRPVDVERQTVVDVLRALDVDASTPAAVTASLARVHRTAAEQVLPPAIVATAGQPLTLPVSGPVVLRPESGPPRTLVGQTLPADIPVGWYDLEAGEVRSTLLVVPERLVLPAGLARAWGWMLQLYQLQSAGSWAMGDYRDLADIVTWSASAGGGGAGLVLCNPLHAMTPASPIEDSPYFPSSRRFRSPLYLRIEDTPEYADADAETRSRVNGLRPAGGADRIDRDAVWAAKSAALALLWPTIAPDRVTDFRRLNGPALDDFALFCALAEQHGRDWRQWPAHLRDPAGPAVRQTRQEVADRVDFHAWLQLLCDEQLAAARGNDMAVGVIHDLAVGIDPGGADAWAMQEVLAQGATVGCPPDAFNQLGQDWGLPPWQPAGLAARGYLPFRDLVRSVLRHAGGIRVDHVMGLFRLWWVPSGNTADRGAYVAYDSRAILGALMIEAHLAGAVVVGEDLGTVEPRVTEALARAGVLGSDVAWFERDPDGAPLPPAKWRAEALASVTTHDLPTVAGWLADEPVRVRAELGQLGSSIEQEQVRMACERHSLIGLLRGEGLLDLDGGGAPEIMLALHRLLVASPATLIVASLADAVGDLRQPNLPGTSDEYPNWRLPLVDGDGRAPSVEQLRAHPLTARLINVLSSVTGGPPSDTVSRVADRDARARRP